MFCFDLLQPPPKRWSVVQTASRVVAAYLRPQHEEFKPGCDVVGELIDAFSESGKPEFVAMLKAMTSPPVGNDYTAMFEQHDRAHARFAELSKPAALCSRLAEFKLVSLTEIIGMNPTEFRIYSMTSISSETYDYAGCANRESMRIVSAPSAPHQLLYQYRPHHTGFDRVEPFSSARGLSARLRAKLRKEGMNVARLDDVLTKWDAWIMAEIAGEMPESPSGIASWTEADPQKAIHFVLGGKRPLDWRVRPCIRLTGK